MSATSPRHPRVCAIWMTLLILAMITGCDMPRDPEGTLRHVRGGVMRVGVCEARPYVIDDDDGGEPTGVEPALITDFAHQLDAEVVWVRGAADDLLTKLERYELDAVVCGLNKESPWAQRVGMSRPYATQPQPRVIAIPPGENGFLMAMDTFISQTRPDQP